ncbi:MAG: alpha/beta hydrolase [Oscillospiraceae bacterium]|nr:alpha/beta hydrolase [Oscillospiraceae bacterium]
MEHRHIESENGITHYWIGRSSDASAKCIVFTHGLTADHSMFEKQIEYFSPAYHVIAWDVPLHGLSRPYSDFSYKQAALELHSILQAEKIAKAVLVGMSMGGYPSQLFADMFPEMTEGFVALDTTPFGLEYYSKSDLWWLKQVEPMAKWFPDGMLRKSMARSVSKTEYSYNKMMEMLKPRTKAEIIQQMGIAYGKFAAENKDVKFPFPVLILVGDGDKTGKVKKYCEAWSQRTGYPLHVIKNAAHFSNGDNAEQVNSEIESFIQAL